MVAYRIILRSYCWCFKDQKDSPEDIDKAFKLFEDHEKKVITFQSLKKVVKELGRKLWLEYIVDFWCLGEDLTDEQIKELLLGANNRPYESIQNDPNKKKEDYEKELEVKKDNFIKILSKDLSEDKKKTS